MQNLIKAKTAFITGASSGIGKACAEQFAALGVHLILTARRLDRLQTLTQELSSKYGVRCLPIKLDIQNNQEVKTVFEKLAKDSIDIDILVNNAGLALGRDKFQDSLPSNWDTVIDTNLKGLLYVTKSALPFMLKKNEGHIINLGSVAGRDCYVGGAVYCATKYAVRALSQSLRLDLLDTNIRVSEIAPGAVETEFSEVRLGDKDKAKKVYQGFDPLTPDDIADTIIYCATRPKHVNISEVVVYPQAQATVTQFRHRR